MMYVCACVCVRARAHILFDMPSHLLLFLCTLLSLHVEGTTHNSERISTQKRNRIMNNHALLQKLQGTDRQNKVQKRIRRTTDPHNHISRVCKSCIHKRRLHITSLSRTRTGRHTIASTHAHKYPRLHILIRMRTPPCSTTLPSISSHMHEHSHAHLCTECGHCLLLPLQFSSQSSQPCVHPLSSSSPHPPTPANPHPPTPTQYICPHLCTRCGRLFCFFRSLLLLSLLCLARLLLPLHLLLYFLAR